MKSSHKRTISFLAALAVCAAGVPVPVLNVSANTFEAAIEINTADVFDIDYQDLQLTDGVWFHFTAPQDGKYVFQTVGNVDTKGFLYENADSLLMSDRDGAADEMNCLLSRDLFAGEDIYIKTAMEYSYSGDIENASCKLQVTAEDMDPYKLFTHYDDSYLTEGDYVYSINQNGTVRFEGCKRTLQNVTVPAEIDGKPVTAIADRAFSYASGNYYGYGKNDYLVSVALPDSITRIEAETFCGCTELTSVRLPANLKEIGARAFHGCTALTEISLPSGLITIESDAFSVCTGLTGIKLPDTLKHIGDDAFEGCTGITALTIPDSVIDIGMGAFSDTGLALTVKDGLAYFGDWLLEIDESFDHSITELVIPDGVRCIPSWIFSHCNNLEKVTLPESIRSIGTASFGDGNPETGDDGTSGLHKLRSVTITGNQLEVIGNYAFCGDDALLHFDFPDSLKEIGSAAFAYSALTAFELPDGLETIGSLAFININANSVIIPESVKTISDAAFGGIPLLVVPNTVEKIDTGIVRPIYGVKEETELYYLGTKEELLSHTAPLGSAYPYFVEALDGEERKIDPEKPILNANVHYNCRLAEQDGSKYLLSDGKAILLQANRTAEHFSFPAEIEGIPVTEVAPGGFKYCTALTELEIPAQIVKIGEDAFDGCENLKTVSFPKGIELPAVKEQAAGVYYDTEHNGIEDLFDECFSLVSVIFDQDDPNYFTDGNAVYTRSPQKLVFVPETAQELNILDGTTEIAMCAVESCLNITVWGGIPESVTVIGTRAFFNSGLQNVVVPASVKQIGGFAFASMSALNSITFMDGIERIPNNCCGGDLQLTDVSIPESVTVIDSEAFFNCQALRRIVIPASVTNISSDVFSMPDPDGKYSWSTMTIPNLHLYGESGSEAQRYANAYSIKFYPVSSSQITAEDGETKAYENLLYGFAKDGSIVILACTAGTAELVIPAEIGGIAVTAIEPYAFRGSALTSVTLPDSVKSVGCGAFSDCKDLTGVVLPSGLQCLEENTFANCPRLNQLNLPAALTEICADAFSGCESLKISELPAGITAIGANAFKGCTAPESFTLPDGLKTAAAGAFRFAANADKTLVQTLYIPASVTEIDVSSFRLQEGGNVYYAGTEAQWNQITFNTSNETVLFDTGTYTLHFSDDTVLNAETGKEGIFYYRVNPNRTVTITGCIAEEGQTYPETLEIPSAVHDIPVTEIGKQLFLFTPGITDDVTKVVIPDTVKSIGEYAFSSLINLKEIQIPDSVTSIGASAFRGCTALTSAVIPDSVTTIANSVFNGCSSLVSVTIPESVTSIGDYAFSGCTALTEINIPQGVTEIGSSAFSRCKSLVSVTFPAGVTEIPYAVLESCDALVSVTILNPECSFCPDRSVFPQFYHEKTGTWESAVTIYGAKDSTAQAYAAEFGFSFSVIGGEETQTGDLNADGAVNLKDVVLLRRYIAGGWNVTLDDTKADINGDGTVSLKDAVLLRRMIAGGWNTGTKS